MRHIPPFLKILPLVILGIVLGEWLVIDWWVAAIGAAVCTLSAYLLMSRKEGSLYAACAIILWSLATTELRTPYTIPEPDAPEILTATITSYPTTSSTSRWQRCDARVEFGGKERTIILHADTAIRLTISERGVLCGYLNPLPGGSYGRLMSRKGYVGELWATSEADWVPTGEKRTSLTILGRRMQHSMVERIERLGLGRDEEAVVSAMLTGWRGDMTPSLRRSYARSGSSHLLAISGLHMGLVAMLVLGCCWLLPIISRRGHIIRCAVAILIMLLYAFATGLSPSVLRATLMFCIAQLALAYGSAKSAINLLAAAASVMLLVNPNNLFDISFQLSFVAVVGIAIGFGPLMELSGATQSRRPLRALWGVVLVGLTSTIATLPLVGHTFSTVSLVGLFLNPFVIVTAEIIVLLGFIWVTLPLGFLQPIASVLIGGAAALQNRLVEGASGLSWAALEVELPAWLVVVCYLLMGAGVILSLVWKEKKVWKIGK